MRCRVGDLAVIILPCEYEGWLVSVLAYASHMKGRPCAGFWLCESLGSVFSLGVLPFGTANNSRTTLIHDEYLQPLRAEPGEDQVLLRAGKPNTADRIEALRSAMRKERA